MRDGITAGDVVGGWMQHDGTANQKPGRDFKSLNSRAIAAGGTTSKDMTDFRKTNDVRLKLGTYKPPETTAWDESTVFGRPVPPGLPFVDLLSHGYRYDWQVNHPPIQAADRKQKKPGTTRTSEILAEVSRAKLAAFADQDELTKMSPLWKMPMFEKVPSKIGYQG